MKGYAYDFLAIIHAINVIVTLLWLPFGKFFHIFQRPDGKARFNVAPYTPPAEDVDTEYPLMLTTGRVVSQFLSGTQTRRIGPLVDEM